MTFIRCAFVVLVSVVTLTGCKEQWETEDYQAGYDDGYEAGRFDVCQDWQQSLPASLHSRFIPRACR